MTRHKCFGGVLTASIMNKIEINKYWGRVINTMNDALLIISKEGTILSTNRSFEEMTGYSAAEVMGKPCTLLRCDACEQTLCNSVGKYWCKLFEPTHEDIRRCRCQIAKKDGTYLTVYKNASVLYDEDGTLLGAVETLSDISEIDRLDKKVEFLTQQLDDSNGYCGIIGQSDEMRKVFNIIEKAAQSDAPVIIFGETGTGKELVARAIHERSNRKDRPYVQVNCAALNESLLESELFGHIRGAFTGAYRDRKGRFETANSGSLFLDEIGDIPLPVQTKLLRVLESKQFERVGDDHPVSVDVRIITATNKHLSDLISQNQFREDLYFRINVLPIHLPPLKKRRDDIPLLVNTFVHRIRSRSGKDISGMERDSLHSLMNYSWPGNIRELKSTLEYAFTLADHGPIRCEHLPPHVLENTDVFAEKKASPGTKAAMEKAELTEALKTAGGNQTQAARILGVNRVTVWNRMRKYGINLKKELRSSDASPF